MHMAAATSAVAASATTKKQSGGGMLNIYGVSPFISNHHFIYHI